MKRHVATIAEESEFQENSFRTREQAPGVMLRIGKLKSGKPAVQSCAFDADQFSEDQAKGKLARLGLKAKAFACAEDKEEMSAEEVSNEARVTQREDGTFDLENVEVLATGVFEASRGGKVTVTQSDLNAIAADTQANLSVLRPPLKLGHTENPFPDGKGAPALGWVQNLSVRGDKLVATFTKVPATLVDAIRKGRWRTRSAELMKWRHPETGTVFNRVLKAVALLGVEMPAVQTLRDIVALSEDPIDWDEIRACVEGGCELQFHLTAAETIDPGGDPDPILPGEATDDDPALEPGDSSTNHPKDEEVDPMPAPKAEDQAREAQEALDTARKELIDVSLSLAVAERRMRPGDVDGEREFAVETLTELSSVRKWADRLKTRPQLPDETKELGSTKLPDDKIEKSTEKDKDPFEGLSGDAWLDAKANAILTEKGWDLSRYEEALVLACESNEEQLSAYQDEAYPLYAGNTPAGGRLTAPVEGR